MEHSYNQMMKQVEDKLKAKGWTWVKYSLEVGRDASNFKRMLVSNIEKINGWLSPIGLKIKIVKK